LIKYIVPGEWKVSIGPKGWSILQGQVRYHPGSKLKFGEVRWWIFTVIANNVTPNELWGRGDQTLGAKTMSSLSVAINCNDINMIVAQNDLDRGAIEIDILFCLLDQ